MGWLSRSPVHLVGLPQRDRHLAIAATVHCVEGLLPPAGASQLTDQVRQLPVDQELTETPQGKCWHASSVQLVGIYPFTLVYFFAVSHPSNMSLTLVCNFFWSPQVITVQAVWLYLVLLVLMGL